MLENHDRFNHYNGNISIHYISILYDNQGSIIYSKICSLCSPYGSQYFAGLYLFFISIKNSTNHHVPNRLSMPWKIDLGFRCLGTLFGNFSPFHWFSQIWLEFFLNTMRWPSACWNVCNISWPILWAQALQLLFRLVSLFLLPAYSSPWFLHK